MSKILKKVADRTHVWFVDDERNCGNSIIVTLQAGWHFCDEPGCGTQGFDTVTDCEKGTRADRVYKEGTDSDPLLQE